MSVKASTGREHCGNFPKEAGILNKTRILSLPNKFIRETKEEIKNMCPKLEIIKKRQEDNVYDEYEDWKKTIPGGAGARVNPAELQIKELEDNVEEIFEKEENINKQEIENKIKTSEMQRIETKITPGWVAGVSGMKNKSKNKYLK